MLIASQEVGFFGVITAKGQGVEISESIPKHMSGNLRLQLGHKGTIRHNVLQQNHNGEVRWTRRTAKGSARVRLRGISLRYAKSRHKLHRCAIGWMQAINQKR